MLVRGGMIWAKGIARNVIWDYFDYDCDMRILISLNRELVMVLEE